MRSASTGAPRTSAHSAMTNVRKSEPTDMRETLVVVGRQLSSGSSPVVSRQQLELGRPLQVEGFELRDPERDTGPVDHLLA